MRPSRLSPPRLEARSTDLVWYAAYGSNMHLARFAAYLGGGRPPGAARAYPGCRDGSAPLESVPTMLPGCVYFALESTVWGGGMAFYEPRVDGLAAARAYLISLSQFSDIMAQEMHRRPGPELDLSEVLSAGRSSVGDGRYETLVYPGELDGRPVLTFTAPWHLEDVELNKPSAGYLRHLAAGLSESHGWDTAESADYLVRCPGVRGSWTAAELAGLFEA